MLCDRLGVSERWACRVVGQHRSTQRREPVCAGDDEALRTVLRDFAGLRPRWGYRRAHDHLDELGWSVNLKRVQRLWREEGLRVPRKARKRARTGDSTAPAGRLHAQRTLLDVGTAGQDWVTRHADDDVLAGQYLDLLAEVAHA